MPKTDPIIIEDFRSCVDRQKFVSSLAKDIFYGYTKLYISLVAGVFALISLRETLDIPIELYKAVIIGTCILLSIVGMFTIFQTAIILWRWWEYRKEEAAILKKDSRKPQKRALIFEALFCLAIAVMVGAVWVGKDYYIEIIKVIEQKQQLEGEPDCGDNG